MARKNTTFKFTDTDLELLDSLATDMGCSRTQAIRVAVRDLRRARGLYIETATAFVDQLRERVGSDALLRFELDEDAEPFVSIDGVRQDDLYVVGQAATFTDGEHKEDFVKVYVGDPANDVRIFIGMLPLGVSAKLQFPLVELDPAMRPKLVAYWTGE